MALNSLNSMKNGIEITEFNAKFWAIFEILDFKGSQLYNTCCGNHFGGGSTCDFDTFDKGISGLR